MNFMCEYKNSALQFAIIFILGVYFVQIHTTNPNKDTIRYCLNNFNLFIYFSVPTEVMLIKREYFNRWYGLKPYFLAMFVSRTPVTIFFALIYLLIVYPATAQPIELTRILMFVSMCVMVALVAESMGTVISSTLSIVVS